MKNKVSPNKFTKMSLTGLSLLAGSILTSPLQAQNVPNLFAGDEQPNTGTEQSVEPSITTSPKQEKAADNAQNLPVTNKSLAPSILDDDPNNPAETMIFDVYAAGKYRGTALVDYTDRWVDLANPSDVLDQMPQVKTPLKFENLLEGRLPAQQIKQLAGVGTVRVDPLNFLIDIGIDQEQAIAKEVEEAKYRKSTINNLSISNRMRVTGSTDFTPGEGYDLGATNDLRISRGAWRLSSGGNFDKGEGFDFTGAVIEHDVEGHTYSAGMLQTGGTNFVGSTSFYGIKAESNVELENDSANFQATPIEVFIPSKSTVRIYKDETQIIYTEKKEFGLTQINTARFPRGSYEVRIVIEEENGNITEERRFFKKSSSLRAFNKPEYTFALGMTRDGFDLLDKPVYEFDYLTRPNDSFELGATIFGEESQFTFEPRLKTFWGNGYNFDVSFNYTSEADMAATANLSYTPIDQNEKVSWYLRARQTLKGHDYENTTFEEEFDFRENISNRNRIYTGAITYSYDDITWNFNAQFSKSSNNKSTYSYGPGLRWRMYQSGPHTITSNASVIKTRTGGNNRVFISYRYLSPGNRVWDYNANTGINDTDAGVSKQINQAISYNKVKDDGAKTSFSAKHNAQRNSSDDIHNTLLNLDNTSKHIASNILYQQRRGTADNYVDSETLDINLDSNLMMTQDSLIDVEKRSVTLSGYSQGSSDNVIVHLKGNAVGDTVAIKANNNFKKFAKVGSTVTLNLAEYEEVKISIEPAGDSNTLLDYDKTPYNVTIYPGNIAQHEWTVNRMYLLTGRAVDSKGEPIAWQRIDGIKTYATTDSTGFFQLEITGEEIPHINTNKNKCVFALPPIAEGTEPFLQVGDITCS